MSRGSGGSRTDLRVLRRLRRESPEHLARLWRGAAIEMTGDVKLGFNSGPDGVTYQRGNVSHVASSPGHPPNSDTGTLEGSITWTEEQPLLIYIHDQTEYGIHQEWGTEFIEPRPFMAPVFEVWRARRLREFVLLFGVIPWR